jgi:hypothetical protein
MEKKDDISKMKLHEEIEINYDHGAIRIIKIKGGYIYKLYDWNYNEQDFVFEAALFVKEDNEIVIGGD